MKKTVLIIPILLYSFLSGSDNDISGRIDAFESLSEQQKIRLIKDVIKLGSFYKMSSDLKYRSKTIGKFFNKKIYGKLRGNDILGYIYDNGYGGVGKSVSLRSLKFFNGTKKFRVQFLKVLLDDLHHKTHLIHL